MDWLQIAVLVWLTILLWIDLGRYAAARNAGELPDGTLFFWFDLFRVVIWMILLSMGGFWE